MAQQISDALVARHLQFLEQTSNVRLDTEDGRHDYYVDDKPVDKKSGFLGVTTLIGSHLFEPFDTDAAVEKVINSKRYLEDTTYRYHKMSKEDMKKKWEQSSVDGGAIHNAIDDYFKTLSTKPFRGEQRFKDVRHCLKAVLETIVPGMILFASEVALVDKALRLTGCFDALFYDPQEDTFILVDWKANSVKTDKWGSKGTMRYTFSMPDNKYWHYHVQTNIYALMLERNYGIKCSKLYVVGFGLDKQEEQEKGPFEDILPSMRQKRILGNVDIHEMAVDTTFQESFVKSRLEYLDAYYINLPQKRKQPGAGNTPTKRRKIL